MCLNNLGSYTCMCRDGTMFNGMTCVGEIYFFAVLREKDKRQGKGILFKAGLPLI